MLVHSRLLFLACSIDLTVLTEDDVAEGKQESSSQAKKLMGKQIRIVMDDKI